MENKLTITEAVPAEGSILDKLASAVGGEAIQHTLKNEMGEVVHAFGTMSLPLPKTHWIYRQSGESFNVPPMPIRLGSKQFLVFGIGNKLPAAGGEQKVPITTWSRDELAEAIRDACRYACKASTMNGTEMDFDPDAMVRNMVFGMLGYETDDGLDRDDWANPKNPWEPSEEVYIDQPNGSLTRPT